jgi:hypothetical protein
MDTAAAISRDTTRTLLNRAIEALVSDAALSQRVSEGKLHIGELERYSSEIEDELVELTHIVADLEDALVVSPDAHLSPARELALAERLIALYIHGCAGAVIF